MAAYNNKVKDMSKENVRARLMLFISRFVVYFILAFLTILCLFSFYLLIINASRSNSELQAGFTLIPSGHFWENLKNAWFIDQTYNALSIGRGLLNSLIISSGVALLSCYFSALTAYAIHVYDFKLKNAAFVFILAIMMIPTQVSSLGYIQLVGDLGLGNWFYFSMIIPSIAAPVVFFYMKQYMDSVLPLEIVESARVDGSGEFMTFNRIVLPIMKPAMAVQAIFQFVGSWNNYFTPALLATKVTDVNMKDGVNTLPIMIAYLRSMQNSKDFDLGLVYMFILLAILPVIVIYLVLSKAIVGGVTSGAVKG